MSSSTTLWGVILSAPGVSLPKLARKKHTFRKELGDAPRRADCNGDAGLGEVLDLVGQFEVFCEELVLARTTWMLGVMEEGSKRAKKEADGGGRVVGSRWLHVDAADHQPKPKPHSEREHAYSP